MFHCIFYELLIHSSIKIKSRTKITIFFFFSFTLSKLPTTCFIIYNKKKNCKEFYVHKMVSFFVLYFYFLGDEQKKNHFKASTTSTQCIEIIK